MEDDDFEPPSFSLGLDLDPQPDPLPQLATLRPIEDDDESPVRVSDPPRAFKRLRRGPRKVESVDERFNVNEEIEDFSSDEDCPRAGVVPPNSVCSSSKPSLHGQGFVTTESGSQLKSSKGKQVSSASASVKVEKKGSNLIFPKLTLSPLRRYQLIDSDSDSDDPSMIEDKDPGNKEVPLVILSPEGKQSNCRSNLWTRRASPVKYQSEDLWKDFHSDKSPCIPTPAFDEVIEEYFTKSKPETEYKYTCNDTKWDETTLPPAHSYFFHKDLRIQKLVRDHLPHFSPLGAGNNQENEQQNVSVIDYIGQFGHEDTRHTQTADQRRNIDKSSKGNKKIVDKSRVDSTSRGSSDWVNPRTYAGLQKNRRVQAESKSAGHWYTGPDGKRVYVNKKGQELAGQIAYRHYRKESGMGLKNPKNKTTGKKKTAATKKSGPKKK